VGHSLAHHAEGGHQFTFFVVNAPTINAFALPGGYIGIHTGLILASRNESELAGVIAHEIAHVTQHHLARGVEQANRTQLPLTLAILAGILLSGGDSDVANAVLATGIGGSAQMQLNFTRAHEHEADRVGMQLLANSDYDPRGMAGFFSRLMEESRYEGEGVPEFLRTHPVTTSRMAEAQSAAEHYPNIMRADSSPYFVARARIRLHHTRDVASLLNQLDAMPDSEESKYLRAITLISQQKYQQGKKLLHQMLAQAPDRIAYRETLGQLHLEQGEYQQALSIYREGLKRYPHNLLLSLSLVRNLIAMEQYTEARERLQEVIRRNPRSANAYRLLAQLESAAGNSAASHLAQAEYYRLMSEPHSALEQLKIASKIKNIDFYHSSRIEALIQDIETSLEKSNQINGK
jgi:predicted Zn-dependent protease